MIHRFVDLIPPLGFVPYIKVDDGGVNPDEYSMWYVPEAGGSPIQVIAASTDRLYEPIFSPDQRQISYQGDARDIRVINRDGSGDTVVDDSDIFRYPNWNIDGTKIIYCDFNDPGSIYLTNPDGTGKTTLYTHTNAVLRAKYSFDGSMIGFLDEDANEIWTMNSDTSGASAIKTILINGVNNFSWANLSNVIAYGDGTSDSDWGKINADGTGDTTLGTQINGHNANCGRQVWSQDDQYVFVLQWTGDTNYSLYRMNSDGSGGALLSPAFKVSQPDPFVFGSRVYATDLSADLYSVALDGSGGRVEDDTGTITFLLGTNQL